MSSKEPENPYEYRESGTTGPVPWEYTGGENEEPRVPFVVYLVDNTVFFKRYHYVMKVFADHLTIEGERLEEPIRIDRMDASKLLKQQGYLLNLKRPGKKRIPLRAEKIPDRALKMARLDLWRKEPASTPRETEKEFELGLNKICFQFTCGIISGFGGYCAMMFLSMIFLYVLGLRGIDDVMVPESFEEFFDLFLVNVALFLNGLIGIFTGICLWKGYLKPVPLGLALFSVITMTLGIMLRMYPLLAITILLFICFYLNMKNLEKQKQYRTENVSFAPNSADTPRCSANSAAKK